MNNFDFRPSSIFDSPFRPSTFMGPKIITNVDMVKTVTKPVAYSLKWWQRFFMYMTPFNPHWPVTPIRWESKTIPSDEIVYLKAQGTIVCHPAMEQKIKQQLQN